MTVKVLAIFNILCLASLLIGVQEVYEDSMSDMYWHATFVEEPAPILLDVKPWEIVTVTVYHPVEEQCDDTPDELASGLKIQIDKAGEYRYCAVSWDLLERYGGQYRFGDIIVLEGAGEFDGPWRIEDLMNPRWEKRIDLLLTPGAPVRKYSNALMRRA